MPDGYRLGGPPIMGITDSIINTVLDKLEIDRDQIEKAKEIINMINFTKEDGKDVIIVDIGHNIQIKIIQ